MVLRCKRTSQSKENAMHNARDTGRTRAEPTPTVPRTLRHLDTDKRWAERDTANKLSVTAREAAYRLRGLADVLYCIGVHSEHQRAEMAFLGASADDIALALERAHAANWAEQEEKDRKAAKRLPAPEKTAHRRVAA
jgi:hypothetical protein